MSKNFIRLLSLILVFLFALFALLSCGKVPEPDQDKEEQQTEEPSTGESKEEVKYDFGGRTIRYVAWWNRGPVENASEREDKLLARMAEMEEKYNAKLEFIEVPQGEYQEQFVASTMAGDPIAEIAFIFSHWYFPGFVSSGLLYPAGDLEAFDFSEDKWIKSVNELTTFQGKQYGFRDGRQAPRGGVWWNKTLFEREGLPNLYELQNNRTWTWDKMLEIAIKATKDTDGDGVIDQWGLNGSQPEWPIVFSNGAEVVTVKEDGKAVFGLTDPRAIEALQFYQDLLNVYNVFEKKPAGSAWDYPMLSFAKGNVAMHISEWWVGDSYLKNGMEDDYGFVMFPMGPKADDYVSHGGEECFEVIPVTVKNPEEVAIIWDYYTDPFPDDDPDAWMQVYETAADDRESLETIRMMQDRNLIKTNLVRGFKELDAILWSDFTYNIWSGAKTPQSAVEEFAQQAQAILDETIAMK